MRSKSLRATVLLPLLLFGLAACGGSGRKRPTLEIRGYGEAVGDPDTALVSLATETRAPSAAESAKLNAELAQKVIDAIKVKLAGKGRIGTIGYSVSAEYEPTAPQPPPPTMAGYRAQGEITAIADSVGVLVPLIDVAVAAGIKREQTNLGPAPRGFRIPGLALAAPAEKAGQAMLRLPVEASAATAEQCARDYAQRAQAIVTALKAKLDDKAKIDLPTPSISPYYSTSVSAGPWILAYRTDNSVTVEATDVSLLGSILDAATAAGASRINYVNFILRDATKARKEAFAKASADAKAKAESIAAAHGVRLKRVLRIDGTGGTWPVGLTSDFAAGIGRGSTFGAEAPIPATPVQPTAMTVQATVLVTYEIE